MSEEHKLSQNSLSPMQKMLSHPLKQKLFLWKKLPLAFWVGLKIEVLDSEKAVIKLPFKRLNLNPFKTIYFATMSMASELSTGVLVLDKIQNQKVKISMFVVGTEGSFGKRGLGDLRFECNEGNLIDQMIQKAIETKEGQTFVLHSAGKNTDGEEVCRYSYTWSVKVK